MRGRRRILVSRLGLIQSLRLEASQIPVRRLNLEFRRSVVFRLSLEIRRNRVFRIDLRSGPSREFRQSLACCRNLMMAGSLASGRGRGRGREEGRLMQTETVWGRLGICCSSNLVGCPLLIRRSRLRMFLRGRALR